MRSYRSLIFVTVISMALILSCYALYQALMVPTPATSLEKFPDMQAQKIKQKQFKNNGELHYLLSATQLQQFFSENRSTFVEPNILFYSTPERNWLVKSKQGDAIGEHFIHFIGDVTLTLVKPHAHDTDPTTMKTPNLTVEMQQERAHSQDQVVISQANHHTRATGFELDLQKGQLFLQKQVKSIYDTTQL